MTQPVQSIKNQYLGINAHLHSYWQSEGGWNGFHTRHIVHLADLLKALLLPMGYTAEVEESLQIRRVDGGGRTKQPTADVLISDLRSRRLQPTLTATPAIGELVSVAELFDPAELSERPYRAVTIYDQDEQGKRRQQPVAWIELLSPANKGDSEDAQIYRSKRMNLLTSGLVFVEMDYLHETPPTFRTIPAYRPVRGQTRSATAHPYRIIVIDPRPGFPKGEAHLFSFDCDQPIPVAAIPLNAGDCLNFDFGIAYRKTYEEALYGLEVVDYAELPVNFRRYSEADQRRIANRMVAVLEAVQKNIDPADGPFLATNASLNTALRQIAEVNKTLPSPFA